MWNLIFLLSIIGIVFSNNMKRKQIPDLEYYRTEPNAYTLQGRIQEDLRQVGGFLRVLRFPSPIKLTATI